MLTWQKIVGISEGRSRQRSQWCEGAKGRVRPNPVPSSPSPGEQNELGFPYPALKLRTPSHRFTELHRAVLTATEPHSPTKAVPWWFSHTLKSSYEQDGRAPSCNVWTFTHTTVPPSATATVNYKSGGLEHSLQLLDMYIEWHVITTVCSGNNSGTVLLK